MIPFEWWIGSRYAGLTRVKRKDRFISFVANSTLIGIALSVATLIVVMSVMNGFRVQVRDRMLSVLPHIQIYNTHIPALQQLDNWQELANQAKKNPHIIGASPLVSASGLIVHGQTLQPVQVRGIDPQDEGQVSELPQEVLSGSLKSLQPGKYNIVIGAQLAARLNAYVGDKLVLLAPSGSISPAGFIPVVRQFTISGIFSSRHYEFDSGMVFVNDYDAAKLFRQVGVAGVRLKVDHITEAHQIAQQLQQSLGSQIYVTDWTQTNKAWFAAVETEKRVMFVILALLVAIASFNLMSSLVMTVKEKQADIAILRTLGASPRSIARIFMVHGALIGFFGTCIGVLLGCLIAYNIDVIVPFIEHVFGVHFLDPSLYFLSALPSQPDQADIAAVAITALVLSFLSTLYPSWRASRLQPAEVLRHD